MLERVVLVIGTDNNNYKHNKKCRVLITLPDFGYETTKMSSSLATSLGSASIISLVVPGLHGTP